MVDLTLPMYLPSSNMLSMKKLVSFVVILAVVKLVNRYLTTFTKISRSLKRPYPNYQMSSLCVFRAYTHMAELYLGIKKSRQLGLIPLPFKKSN